MTTKIRAHTGRASKSPTSPDPTEALRAAGVVLDEDPAQAQAPAQAAQSANGSNGHFPIPPCTPALDDAALYGLPGEIVQTMAPHTEAATGALLGSLLVAFGAAVGRGSWMTASGCRHHPNLFGCIVGASSRARKSTAANNVRELFGRAGILPPTASGLSTGEGLIHAIRDPASETEGEDGAERDGGIADKRLLVIESELARALSAMKREGNSLSPVLREAWDGSPLRTLTKREALQCNAPHIALIAAVTAEELRKRLDETELWNGLGNRFLWLLVTRPHLLPEAGELPWRELGPLMTRLAAAATFAQGAGELQRSPSAAHRWRDIYADLAATAHTGTVACLTDRSEAQVLRLAMIYALLDRSRNVEPDHLAAALAFWRFAEASVITIFGGLSRDARNVMAALADVKPGELSTVEITDHTGKQLFGERLGNALAELVRIGQVASRRDTSTGGRPRELWHAN